MAYISEIEAAIRAIIDVGTFQNLCNEILRREINAPITSLGSQSGTNKTTFGTPDAYFYKDDKYVFVEYTTTENESTRLFNKINSDLEKCFDENSTKIPLSKIEKSYTVIHHLIYPLNILNKYKINAMRKMLYLKFGE